jgi:hypothetical protein
MPSAPFDPVVVLGHGTQTLVADTVGGIVLALLLFALYYRLFLVRASD